MKTSMKFALLSCISVVTLVNAAKNSSTSVKCNDQDFETVFSKIISVSEPDRKYPENVAQLPKFCSETNELLRRFEEHKNKCLKATMRNFVGILSYSIKVQVKRMCAKKRPVRVQGLFQAAPCINKHKAKVAKCFDAMSLAFSGIKRAENSKKMPFICCEYVQLYDCFRKIMVANGCEAQLPVLKEQIHMVMGNYIDASCGEYTDDSDRCEKLGPSPKPPKGAKAKKFITNLAEIFDSIN